jgi:hypothetical protein
VLVCDEDVGAVVPEVVADDVVVVPDDVEDTVTLSVDEEDRVFDVELLRPEEADVAV